MRPRLIPALLILFITTSCIQSPDASDQTSLALAAFTENYVEVAIQLDISADDAYFLSATFTPPEGYHLYSKDIPFTGVDGLGRPTLLEVPEESQLKVLGELSESVQAEVPNFEPRELLVYPAGAVTLRLPVELPAREVWVDDFVKVTFMACSESTCKPPVTGKIISIRIPGVDAIK